MLMKYATYLNDYLTVKSIEIVSGKYSYLRFLQLNLVLQACGILRNIFPELRVDIDDEDL